MASPRSADAPRTAAEGLADPPRHGGAAPQFRPVPACAAHVTAGAWLGPGDEWPAWGRHGPAGQDGEVLLGWGSFFFFSIFLFVTLPDWEAPRLGWPKNQVTLTEAVMAGNGEGCRKEGVAGRGGFGALGVVPRGRRAQRHPLAPSVQGR